jgi:hypothetical protein
MEGKGGEGGSVGWGGHMQPTQLPKARLAIRSPRRALQPPPLAPTSPPMPSFMGTVSPSTEGHAAGPTPPQCVCSWPFSCWPPRLETHLLRPPPPLPPACPRNIPGPAPWSSCHTHHPPVAPAGTPLPWLDHCRPDPHPAVPAVRRAPWSLSGLRTQELPSVRQVGGGPEHGSGCGTLAVHLLGVDRATGQQRRKAERTEPSNQEIDQRASE